MFIIAPNLTEEAINKIIEEYQKLITENGGTVEKIERWGERKLAYRVKKFQNGYYVLFLVRSKPDVIKEVERRFKLSETVIRYLTVKVDEKILEKQRPIAQTPSSNEGTEQ